MRIHGVARLLAAGTLVLAPGACTASPPSPPGPPPFPISEFDLCERLDLSPLDPLSLTVWEESPIPDAVFADGSGDLEWVEKAGTCAFGMRTATGYQAELRVRTTIEESVAEAESTYERYTRRTEEPEGTVEGLGDQTTTYLRQSRSDLRLPYTEYEVLTRTENLVVIAELGLGGEERVPVEALVGPTRGMVAATIAAVPPAPLSTPIPGRAKAYDTADLDLCAGTDLGPFAQLGLTLDGPPSPRYRDEHFPEWVGCGFGLASEGESTIRSARLLIDAYGLATLTIAERDYVNRVESELSIHRRPPWSRDGGQADLGDRSDALARTVIIEGGRDRLRSEYQILVLHGNLVVKVELSVYDEAEVAKETLAGIVHGLTVETIAQVPLVPAT